jgi:hypothetical protein
VLRCLLPLSGIPDNSGYIVVELSGKGVARAADFGNNWIGGHELNSHQFFGRANHGAFHAVVSANTDDLDAHFGVRDMSAIPSEKKIHSVDGCQCNMKCVASGLLWNRPVLNEMACEIGHVVAKVKQSKWLEHIQPLPRELRIAIRCLVKDDLRNENAEIRKPIVPPVSCGGLMSGYDNIGLGRDV